MEVAELSAIALGRRQQETGVSREVVEDVKLPAEAIDGDAVARLNLGQKLEELFSCPKLVDESRVYTIEQDHGGRDGRIHPLLGAIGEEADGNGATGVARMI